MNPLVTINNEEFVLDPSGAMFWASEKSLLIADVHFGKISHFRKHGAAVPQKAIERNFEKLNQLLSRYHPESIIFLGDLFHSTMNSEWRNFEKWVSENSLAITLISGNHDIIPKYLFEEIGMLVLEKLQKKSFLLTHHPTEEDGLFNLSGHIHPGIKLKGSGRQFVNLACFFKTENQLILPAFGTFTGKHILSPKETDEIYAIAEGEVILVSNN